ncbi:WG repeat-containing protein [Anaeromassilibacillus senegalensis]|uniref:WG repeat-containing protein n=1 Tax=Anaeromassilibacillus senegalensis TaxID=1673717 RepID=UPI0006822F18|nr:WG repeat-containing protein [Anaeromassilibacillus senegalensis]
MKRGERILLAMGCVLLLLVSWIMAFQAKSDTQKQTELLEQAAAYIEDEIYIRAVPLLEEATGYSGERTAECEKELKKVYLALAEKGYRRKYTDLLELQMARADAKPEVFMEAAQYYLTLSDDEEALKALRVGVQKTGDEELNALYEENRYGYTFGRTIYEDVAGAANGAIQVRKEGAWGLARTDGTLVIPCIYDKVSTYSGGQVLVKKSGVISAVDADNNRVALLHAAASDFGNYSEARTSLLLEDGWHIADGEFHTAAAAYEALGMYAGGYAAAKQGGRWGVVDQSGEWYIPPEYDEIVLDELGRCYGQSAVFARTGADVFLLINGQKVGEPYQDARPFADGYAAVKREDHWGFIDAGGNVKIDFQFDDALSFGGHLAAVQIGQDWGYVSLSGEVVIEPFFLKAKSFCDGSAPVCTVDGWEFITLLEETI